MDLVRWRDGDRPARCTRSWKWRNVRGLDATVLGFWRVPMNDLRTNNVRGYLAVRACGPA